MQRRFSDIFGKSGGACQLFSHMTDKADCLIVKQFLDATQHRVEFERRASVAQ
jgi:hypothetical protein